MHFEFLQRQQSLNDKVQLIKRFVYFTLWILGCRYMEAKVRLLQLNSWQQRTQRKDLSNPRKVLHWKLIRTKALNFKQTGHHLRAHYPQILIYKKHYHLSISVPSRGTVLQACSVTSGLLAALGIIIRQVRFQFLYFPAKLFLFLVSSYVQLYYCFSVSLSITPFKCLFLGHCITKSLTCSCSVLNHTISYPCLTLMRRARSVFLSFHLLFSIESIIFRIGTCRYHMLHSWKDYP